MKLLAFETSGLGGSVCVFEDGKSLAEQEIPAEMRSAQGLAPAIARALELSNCTMDDLGAVAVTQGPGSFTGLRVGVTTAKVIAYSRKIHLLGVDTLAAIARQVPEKSCPFWVLMDALRGQLFAARFRQDATGRIVRQSPTELIAIEDWLGRRGDDGVAGPGVSRVSDRIAPTSIVGDASHAIPRAASVAQEAWELHLAGNDADPFRFVPDYYRPSYAEEAKPTASSC